MSSSFRTPYVKSGIWVDYDLSRWKNYQLLVREETAQILTNSIAVATTLALPHLLILIQLCSPAVVVAMRWVARVALRRLEREPGRVTSHALETFQNASSLGDAATRLTREHLGMRRIRVGVKKNNFKHNCIEIYHNIREDRWGFSLICLIILALVAFYIGIQVIAILNAGIISTGYGISTSPTCGWWIPAFSDPVGPFSNIVSWDREVEYAALTYADVHYGDDSAERSGSEYVKQRINYQEHTNRSCPFAYDYCVNNHSAILLDTGMQNARVLGINTAEQYFFHKQVICAPLIPPRSGRLNTRDVTKAAEHYFKAKVGEPYDMMGVAKYDDCNGSGYLFQPFDLPLNIKDGIPRVPNRIRLKDSDYGSERKRATLLFIRSCNLFYLGPSSDPIFPADHALDVNGQSWMDKSQGPHVIGCQESRVFCDSTMNCFEIDSLGQSFFSTDVNRSASEAAVLNLLQLSMTNSAMSAQGLSTIGLLAEKYHRGAVSIALADNHWHTEIRHFWHASLARLQAGVVDVARGKNGGRARYQEVYPGLLTAACSSVKFQTVGWKNINLLQLVSLSCCLFLLWISTITFKGHVLLIWFYGLLIKPLACRVFELVENSIDLIANTSAKIQHLSWKWKPPSRNPHTST